MNLKQLSLAALASMALFACSNDESLGGSDENGTPKAVYMKLEGISASAVNGRSTDAPTESGNHTVTVSDVAVIFYQDGGNITDIEEITSADDKKWKALVDPESGDGYRFVVGHKADKVMVIGNYQNLKEKTDIEGKVVENQPISGVTDFQIPLSSQNVAGTGTDETTKACVTLHGDAPMTKKVGEKAPEDNDYDVYEAHVDITPIISRVEIKSLGCVFNKQDEGTAGTPTEHLYTSVTVKGIGMVDYYNMGTLGKDYTTQMVTNTTSNPDGLIYDPEHASVPEGGYKFCGGENASWGWSYDMIGASNGITLTSGDVSSGSVTKYVGATAETQTQNESRTFAYNFFPKGEIANVRVWVEAQKESENAKKSFVVTANFKDKEDGGTVVEPQAGKIYQFDYLFNETVPGVWDKDQKVVYVKVTVRKWTIITVYPDFH